MKDAESGEKSNVLREVTRLRRHTLRMQVNVSVCVLTVKSRLLIPTPVHFPILMREPLQNSLFASCYQNNLWLREAGGFQSCCLLLLQSQTLTPTFVEILIPTLTPHFHSHFLSHDCMGLDISLIKVITGSC